MSCETHGKCDDRCHSAKAEKCGCVCNGLNHGIVYLGSVRAAEALHRWNEAEVEEEGEEVEL